MSIVTAGAWRAPFRYASAATRMGRERAQPTIEHHHHLYRQLKQREAEAIASRPRLLRSTSVMTVCSVVIRVRYCAIPEPGAPRETCVAACPVGPWSAPYQRSKAEHSRRSYACVRMGPHDGLSLGRPWRCNALNGLPGRARLQNRGALYARRLGRRATYRTQVRKGPVGYRADAQFLGRFAPRLPITSVRAAHRSVHPTSPSKRGGSDSTA